MQIDAVKASARAKRSVIKMTLKGAARRIAYAAVQNELREAVGAVTVRIREERRALASDTRQLAWVDWLQQQAGNGRNDALEALRVARGRGRANTLAGTSRPAAVAPPLDAQVTKQGTVIQKVGEHEIRDTSKGLNVETNASDDVLVELIARAAERFEGGLTAYGEKQFYQLYFQEPGKAEAEFEADVRKTILMVLYSASGDIPPDKRWRFIFDKSETFLDCCTIPEILPAWLTEADLEFCTEEFKRTGFRGGLNWYRNLDRNWELAPFLSGAKIRQPSLFVAGEIRSRGHDISTSFRQLGGNYAGLDKEGSGAGRRTLDPAGAPK